jgi:Peptidase C10 family/Spi protease inhibitor/Secretion system C-terminal sorting domain
LSVCQYHDLNQAIGLKPAIEMMKKNAAALLCMSLCIALALSGFAKIATSKKAVAAAQRFAQTQHRTADINRIFAETSIIKGVVDTVYYIVPLTDSGFVIISGSENITPVLAYSCSGNVDSFSIPPAVQDQLHYYAQSAAYYENVPTPVSTSVAASWRQLSEGDSLTAGISTSDKKTTIGPLLQTAWNQAPYYNALCPLDSAQNKRTVTGCVATVMAQLMKYWQWPVIGIGSHGYSDGAYGNLYANFGTTKYFYATMPNSISYYNTPIAQLMYHAGVGVNMQYGTGSSTSYVLSNRCPIVNNAQYALINYFSFSKAMQYAYRSDFDNAGWISLLEQEISAGRPLVYDGSNDTLGHSFIADGFDAANRIHFNWGWGGSYNGYFNIDSLSPAGISLMKNHEVLYNIFPDTSKVLVLADSIYSDTVITERSPFALRAKIINVKERQFSGSLIAELTSDYYDIAPQTAFVQNVALQFGDSTTATFHFQGSLAGSYHVNLLCVPANAASVPVASGPTYFNNAAISIFGSFQNDACTIFPNPANRYIFINTNGSGCNEYKLTDIAGREMQSGILSTPQAVIPISVETLPTGVYLVVLETASGRQIQKVTVTH